MPDRKEMVRLYHEGLTQNEIAKKLGSHQATVSACLKEEGIACKNRRWLDWPVEDMRRWYEEDRMTVEQIAQRLGRQRIATNKVLRRNNVKMRRRGPKDGPEHTGWKGGRTIDKSGYILVYAPEHPDANVSGYIREHRLIAEVMLGRPLRLGEVIHHKNDDRGDNHPENLQVFASNADHLAETLKGKCPQWTEEGRARTLEGIGRWREERAILRQSKLDDLGSPGTNYRSTD